MMTDSTRRIVQMLMARGADFAAIRRSAISWQDPLGEAPCEGCGKPVFYAWDAEQERVALVPDDAGDVVVQLDPNSIPWCRPAAAQLELGDELFRQHKPECRHVAPVMPIAAAPSYAGPGRPVDPQGRTA
jgi:hypothetical protein